MNSRALISFLAVLLKLMVYPLSIPAADRFWVGDGNWSATTNWSTSSGGTRGAAVPGTSDRAVFDANSTNATVNVNVDCGGLLLTNWAGTITIGDACTVKIQNSFNQYSGAIVGGTNLLTFYNSSCNFAGGTLTPHTSGWVRFHNAGNSTGFTITGKPTLENVSFYTSGGGGTYPWAIADGSTVTVSRVLVFDGEGDNRLDTGSIVVHGHVTNNNGTAAASSRLILAGANPQTLHGASTAFFPNLVIAKPSNTLLLSGTIKTARNWTHLSGNVNPGVSTVILYPRNDLGCGITSTTGRATFYNLSFDQTQGGGDSYTYTLHGNLTLVASNTLSFGLANGVTGAGKLLTGTIEALGNININTLYSGSTVLLKIKGSNSQTMTGAKASYDAAPPHVVIEKPSGTLILAGTFSLFNKWTHLAGKVDPGTSYVWMYAFGSPRVVITSAVGRVNFYDVRFDQTAGGGSSYYLDFADGTTLVVTNRLMFDPTSGFQVRKGCIEVHGDVINQSSIVGGTTLLRPAGSSNHVFSGISPFNQVALNMDVNKSDGTFTLATPLTFGTANKDFTVSAGTFNLSTNTLTLSANGADFRMTNSAVLMTTVDAVTNGMVAVTGSGIARVDGDLFITVPEGYTPNPNRTNLILAAASEMIQNTPFEDELATVNYQYDASYNIGGNRVTITKLRFQPGGSVLMIQ